MNSIQDYLKKYNIKPSVQRIAIMDYLLANRTHPTVDEIYNALYKEIPTLSKTTVYNTLKLFIEQQALNPLMIDEKNLRFDVDTSRHAHFHCTVCGEVTDFIVEGIEQLYSKELAELEIAEVHLYYKGVCKNCKK